MRSGALTAQRAVRGALSIAVASILFVCALAGCASSGPGGSEEIAAGSPEYLDTAEVDAAWAMECDTPVIPPGVEEERVGDVQRDLRRQGAISLTANVNGCIFALAAPDQTLTVRKGSTQAIIVREAEFTAARFEEAERATIARAESDPSGTGLGAGIDAAVGKIVVSVPDPREFCAPLAANFPGMFICREGSVEPVGEPSE